ncbi:DUF416 family protein [Microbacterium sp. C7(2022)]|nr:DUF416 family protein [Microbacterium sp. C7(2022)]
MNLRTYDEGLLVERLSRLDKRSKTVFAASCAQLLLPMFERYSRSEGRPELGVKLQAIVSAAWAAATDAPSRAEMLTLQAEAEAMVPSDEDNWTHESPYAQNAAAAAAYAIRTWLTDDPQEAGWAARQVYELADSVVLQQNPEIDLTGSDAEDTVLGSAIVQSVLETLARTLGAVEDRPFSVKLLRADAEESSRVFGASVP